jgi:hypothetical protein
MMKIILWGLAIYFIYRLIFGFIVPVSKVASQMKDKVREMQDAQEEARRQFEQQQQQQYQQQTPKATPVKGNEDYIEFEEVKGGSEK